MKLTQHHLTQLILSLALAGLLSLALFLIGSIHPAPIAYAAGETCFATIDGTTVYSSTDASAVQTAVDAAIADDIIKIAGTCAGVQTTASEVQTVYISKSLTLQGGYTTTTWLGTPDWQVYTTTLDAQASGRVVNVDGAVDVTLQGLQITNGSSGNGSGFWIQNGAVVTLSEVLVDYNSGGVGATYVDNSTLYVYDSTFDSNSGGSSQGGAIRASGSNAQVSIAGSTFTNNSIYGGGGAIGIVNGATVTVANSTFSGNMSRNHGGAIFNNGGFLSLAYSTIVSNTADNDGNGLGDGGGLYVQSAGSAVVTATLLISNTDLTPNSLNDCYVSGNVTSGGYNLVGLNTGCTFATSSTDQTVSDALLEPLADNGGETQTHALQATSPAIDIIPNGTAGCGSTSTTDQRGISRPQGRSCDIGAYEMSAPDLTLSGNGQVIANGDASPTSTDDTDFGRVRLLDTLTHTFTISNDGAATLTLAGSPMITLTNSSHFTLTQPLSTTLAPGETTTFTLTFAPQSLGSFTDTVTIVNNTTHVNPFTFVISGTGYCPSPIYVDQSATLGNNDGSSWDDAYLDLQDGLALARTCAPLEVWVASGVYTPGLNQSDTFTLTSGIALYGGFAGTESQRTERDWETNLTVLSGDINGDDTTDANGVVTDTANISDTNSYHVIWADGVTDPITESTVLDGFSITAGKALGIFDDKDRGGGFYCDGEGSGSECSPRLSNVTFSGNDASSGGGIFNNGSNNGLSSPSLSNVIFSGNTAEGGGGMFNSGYQGNSSPYLVNVTFSGNTANYGGAMYNYGESGEGSPSLVNVTFSGNTANNGGAMFNDAWGAGGFSRPSLVNVTFSGNSASNNGGAMYNDSWGNGGTSSPSLSDVTFSGNTANNDGGAMYSYAEDSGSVSNPSLITVTFSGNTANDDGGAMYNRGYNNGVSSPSLENVIFSGNTANDSGGAMYNYGDTNGASMSGLTNVIFSGNTAADKGGAMSNYGSDNGASRPTLVNVTFSGNSAYYGGAIANYTDNSGTSTPSLSNVILWGNTATIGTQLYNITATPSISYSLIQSDTTNAIVNDAASSVIYGSNILTDDPLFVDDDGTDDAAGTLDDDLRLSDDSPAIDAGDNDAIALSTDLDGNSRFYDDTGVTDTGNGAVPLVDMGAYEKQSNSSTGVTLYLPIVVKDY